MATTKSNRRVDSRSNSKALLFGLLAALVVAPFLFVAYFLVLAWIYFANGGDLGGYGAAPVKLDAWWWFLARVVGAVAAIVLDIYIGLIVYRRFTRR